MEKVTPVEPEATDHVSLEQDREIKEDQKSWLSRDDWDYDQIPIQRKYEIETGEIKTDEGKWSMLRCRVMALHEYYWEQGIEPRAEIGSYVRNYWSLFDTFHPFRYNGQEYALYSPDYTTTRVMKLPECVDIAGEEPQPHGFCPTEFFVPCPERGKTEYEQADGSFGFVSGCVWGDDTSMKIQFLDLSGIEDGKLVRDERLGYHELPGKISLENAVDLGIYSPQYDERMIQIASYRTFHFDDQMKPGGYVDGLHDLNESPNWKFHEINNE